MDANEIEKSDETPNLGTVEPIQAIPCLDETMFSNDCGASISVHGEGGEHQTPTELDGLTTMTEEWLPICQEEFKPKEGMEFTSLEECEKFYKSYAQQVGFTVRKSSSKRGKNGVLKYKYFVCSKQSVREVTNKSMGEVGAKKMKWTTDGCNALVGIRRIDDSKYLLSKFYEGHTHLLATSRKHQILKSNIRVKSVDRTMSKSFSLTNVGASKAHCFIKEQVGGFHHVGGSEQDFENFQRDLKVVVKDSDAHMFIDNLKRKHEVNPAFYFAYEVDDNGGIKHVFWADGSARKNYALYGDVVSFDTTYDTNRYKMIFAPFTGIDNHRLCVTFGAAFLGDKKAESFAWLFEKFLDAMGGHKPLCIITDQDPAMKVAIENVFDTSTHKFFTWHIMRNLSEKVGVSACSDVALNTQFMSCVYNSETSEEFDLKWRSIIANFGLEKSDWLSHLYEIRYMWIPAYFKNLFLGSMLRATSRSESKNSFFSNFTNPRFSLVEFWMRFESAMELQRHRQSIADHQTTSSMPELKTNKDIERHAGTIYTHANFYKFQDELWLACMDCQVDEKKEVEEGLLISIMDASQNGKIRQVVYNPLNHVAHCSCKMFEGEGIPCRHILCILKGKRLHELPSYYIVNRWTKMASSKPIFNLGGNILEGCSQMSQVDKLIYSSWLEFLNCMQIAQRDPEKLTVVLREIKGISKQLEELKGNTSESRTHESESFVGSSALEQVEIFLPKQVNTKGSCKQIEGGNAKTIEQQQKRKRLSS